MKEETVQLSIRVPKSLADTIFAIATKKNANITEVMTVLCKIGLENSKQSDEEINQLKNLMLRERAHAIADATFRITMKERFMVENFKKLTRELRWRTLSIDDQKRIAQAGIERIKEIFGDKSPEHDEVKSWTESKG